MTRRLRGGTPSKELTIYTTTRLNTEPNLDTGYHQVGIIHITESGSSNAVRHFLTGVANIFGRKGFDGKIYDAVRTSALNKMEKQLTGEQKVCNLRIDFENTVNDSILVHLYGTLYDKN
jgi:uncharacterized protein YbjQ (UPF0145 family)